MTTVAPLGGATFPGNETAMSTEDFLYKSSGAIVAAIVIGVIIIFTVVLVLLKMYNRKMRMRRELEPKSPKPTSPASTTGQPGNSSVNQPTTVTFIPVDIHMENR
ncbi:noncompact myelin-associated protein [Dromiciops gliroides]|uniref:noncompact myelin-associated protein n=1 Tax=Dromiciops gliroides TaxID=33562 RepID=UPI001CC67B11|nr:noncompact myelin-associated protein [Dromiciops gliroides]